MVLHFSWVICTQILHADFLIYIFFKYNNWSLRETWYHTDTDETLTELTNNLNHCIIIHTWYLPTCMQAFIQECNTRQNGTEVSYAQQWDYTSYFKIMQTIFMPQKVK